MRDKQKIIGDICPLYKEYGTCEQCNTELDIDDEPCYYGCMANAIVNNGYRKSSEIAEEIFGEIEAKSPFILDHVDGDYIVIRTDHFAELKKKYTEGK